MDARKIETAIEVLEWVLTQEVTPEEHVAARKVRRRLKNLKDRVGDTEEVALADIAELGNPEPAGVVDPELMRMGEIEAEGFKAAQEKHVPEKPPFDSPDPVAPSEEPLRVSTSGSVPMPESERTSLSRADEEDLVKSFDKQDPDEKGVDKPE